MALRFLLLLTSVTLAAGQRPFFAGSKPIGYPEIVATTTATGLENKFGEGDSSTTTQRLPLEALGDKDLVDRLSKLPVDKQPFWFINWQALETHRKNPQSYPQRPSQFIVGTQAGNSNFASGNINSASGNVNSGSGSVNSASANVTSETGILANRNGGGSDDGHLSSEPIVNDSRKPNGSAVSSQQGVKNKIQAQYFGLNPAKPTTGKPAHQNQDNNHWGVGYGYF